MLAQRQLAAPARARVAGLARPLAPRASRNVAANVFCGAAAPEAEQIKRMTAACGVVAAGLCMQALAPAAALAARSGGRVSSSGFAARRTGVTPSRTASATARTQGPASSTTVVHHHTTVVAPSPMFGGFGWGMPFGGFGFGGFAMRPAFIMPFGFFGGMLQMMLLLLVGGMVFGFVKGAMGGNKKQQKKDDWDSL
ncbi:hypothetical protein Rsub_08767 [Raphidocelis subcapitata]|uniref:Uncharacterized protein n=1 Tax=Raphidocelis subcapitata TaxID=307507 RepID=A0A2V0PBA8_9CHLO|nr:hypothetical protein Rsub_08767 [Raphidocelis subcapitata]|eukprot:GBF96222.1 hypothetical protein Rsub_08767 [Raphidocelis subcapitata]